MTSIPSKNSEGVTPSKSEGVTLDIPKNCANPRIPPRVVRLLQRFQKEWKELSGHHQRLALGKFLDLPLRDSVDEAIREIPTGKKKKRYKQYADLDFSVPEKAVCVRVVVFYRQPRTSVSLSCFVVPSDSSSSSSSSSSSFSSSSQLGLCDGHLLCLGCGNKMNMTLRDPILQQLVSLALSPHIKVEEMVNFPGTDGKKMANLYRKIEKLSEETEEDFSCETEDFSSEMDDFSIEMEDISGEMGSGLVEEEGGEEKEGGICFQTPSKKRKRESKKEEDQEGKRKGKEEKGKEKEEGGKGKGKEEGGKGKEGKEGKEEEENEETEGGASSPPSKKRKKMKSLRLSKRVVSMNGTLTAWISQKDHQLFCGGSCRAAFFETRSGSALRRRVHMAELQTCSTCGVLCGDLLATLLELETVEEREEEALRVMPRFKDYPKQLKRLIEKPTPGKLYQADHVIPVSKGGGECNLSNMQTLCVLCHLLKTKKEAKERSEGKRKEKERKKKKAEEEEEWKEEEEWSE